MPCGAWRVALWGEVLEYVLPFSSCAAVWPPTTGSPTIMELKREKRGTPMYVLQQLRAAKLDDDHYPKSIQQVSLCGTLHKINHSGLESRAKVDLVRPSKK